MGVFYISVFIFTWLGSATAQASFVEACLGNTGVLQKTFQCKMQNTSFSLEKGLKITVTSAKGNQKEFPTQKIKHLPNRITNLGFQDESVQFIATKGNLVATVSIPCGQSAYAFVGLGPVNEGSPSEAVAECH